MPSTCPSAQHGHLSTRPQVRRPECSSSSTFSVDQNGFSGFWQDGYSLSRGHILTARKSSGKWGLWVD